MLGQVVEVHEVETVCYPLCGRWESTAHYDMFKVKKDFFIKLWRTDWTEIFEVLKTTHMFSVLCKFSVSLLVCFQIKVDQLT